jgi:bile acid:Na+ symporter, BASS family
MILFHFMESSVLLSILLPVALGVIMFGLGLTLSVGDFTRIVNYPKAVALGLACQVLVLPCACFGIAKLFNLSPELSIGLILISASPGGVTSNFYTHLAKGDVVLNITLTAFGTLLCIFTLPFIINFSMEAIMDQSTYVPLQFSNVLQMFAIILLPVSIGMFIREKKLSLAGRLQGPVKIFSLIFLILLILSQVIKERENLASYWQQAGLAVLSFNLLSMVVGFFVPRIFNLPIKQSIAISMGSGIRNTALSIAIALSSSLLNNSAMSIPAALYTVVMYFTAALFGYIISNKLKLKEASYPPVVD